MKINLTKRVSNRVIENDLREKTKALLYYLYLKANLKLEERCFNICKCSFSELLDLNLLKTSDNTKNNRRALRKLLDELKDSRHVQYEVDKDVLVVEVFITEPPKEIGNYTQIPYSIVNNKDIPIILVPTYLAILRYDYQKGVCNPSMSTLAKDSGCSINTFKKRMKKLLELQLLQVDISSGGHSKDTNTFYTSNRHISEEGDFYYRLIDVKNPRFEYSPKNKNQESTSVKSILKKKEQQDQFLVEECK